MPSEFDVMTGSWHTILTDWYRHRRRRHIPEALAVPIDIELMARCRNPQRVDSSISFGSLTLVDEDQAGPDLRVESQSEEPIHLKLDFGDGVYTRPLHYGTFSRWSALEGLMTDLEKDGMIIEEIWDVVEQMRVCGGDWDARVRPGWNLQVHCQNVQTCLDGNRPEDGSDSEDTDDEEECWVDEILGQYQEWCLPRWRDRVEQEKSINRYAKEPSWVMLGLGCLSTLFFIVAVIIYTT